MPEGSNFDDGSIYTQPASAVAAMDDYFIAPIDVSKWGWINAYIGNDSYDALLVPKWSNDGTTWRNLEMYPMTTLDAGDVSAAGTEATNAVLGSFVSFKYFCVQADEYTSGTPTGMLQLLKNGLPGFQLTKTYTRVSYGDHQRNIDNITVLASGAVTADGESSDFINWSAKGIKLYISPGSFGAGASTITVTIQERDLVSGMYHTILQSAALVDSTFQVLKVYPGIPDVTNVAANDFLPRTWRVTWQATNWGSGGSTLGISCALNE